MLALLFLSATTAVAAATAQVAATFPVQLSRQDRGAITRTVCSDAAAPEAERIHASTTKRGAATVQVEVQCRPHRMDGPFPIARRASCSNRTGQWRCDDAHEAAQAPVPLTDDPVVVIPVGLTPRAAAEIVVETSQLLAPPFSEPGRWYYGGECRVGKSSAPAKRGIEPFDLQCKNGRLAVSRYCTNGRCNYFIVSGSRGAP
jgi:hypothetical protein